MGVSFGLLFILQDRGVVRTGVGSWRGSENGGGASGQLRVVGDHRCPPSVLALHVQCTAAYSASVLIADSSYCCSVHCDFVHQ